MATWDIPSNILSVTYNSNKILLDQIQSSIADVGHDTPLFKAPDDVYNELPMCCIYERNLKKKTLIKQGPFKMYITSYLAFRLLPLGVQVVLPL